MKLTIVFRIFILFSMIYLFSSTETATEAEMNLNSGIHMKINMNMAEGRMKRRSSQSPPPSGGPGAGAQGSSQFKYSGAPTTASSNLGQTTNIAALAGDQTGVIKDIDMGTGPVYWTGWVKYINYDKLYGAPASFFKNNEYFEQMKLFPKASMNETSPDILKDTYTYIRGANYFYGMLFKDNINFLSSRNANLKKTYDMLYLNDVMQVTEEPGFGVKAGVAPDQNPNGIQDYGNFAEGFCFKVLTNKVYWLICTDTGEEKKDLMARLQKLKVLNQRSKGIYNILQKPDDTTDSTIQNLLNPDQGKSGKTLKDANGNMFVNATDNFADGYWIILQDWSQCNLKCGGGVSTLHRMCVPPKTGGKPCDGEPIMTKPCNTQPCPVTKELVQTQQNKTDNLKPIVKIMPFSTRPQRYTVKYFNNFALEMPYQRI